MLGYRRFLAAGALAAALTGCAQQNRSGAADADILRGKINSAVAEAEQTERNYGVEGGRLAASSGERVPFRVLSFSQLRGWSGDSHAHALVAFRLSCEKIARMTTTRTLGGMAGSLEDWKQVCARSQNVPANRARAFFERNFVPVKLEPSKRALVTAYYEPELRASRRAVGRFVHPLYARPPELVINRGKYGVIRNGRFQPFYSRGEVYRGALAGRGLEIAFVDDAVDAFFLHIQGSGRLRFTDGSTTRVAFAAKNGYPYKSAGKEMIRRGLTTPGRASAQVIKDYVRRNPRAGLDLLSVNRSYIFFREAQGLNPRGGPVGALNVQLSAGRSIAVDRRYTPLGAPVWLETDDSPAGPLRRLVVAQDTGSAIKGVQRADFFWGTGAQAGAHAGRMKHRGTMTVLFPASAMRSLRSQSTR